MTEEVSCRLSTSRTKSRFQFVACGIRGGQSDTAVGFLRVLLFAPPVLILPTAVHSTTYRGSYCRSSSGWRAERTKLWTMWHRMFGYWIANRREYVMKRLWHSFHIFSRMYWIKLQWTSIRIFSDRLDIRSRHPLNTSYKHYHLSQFSLYTDVGMNEDN
jgi:hypothetical protein